MNTKHFISAARRIGWHGHKPRADGFTLVETMVVLVVAALLISVGVPSLTAALDAARLTSASNTFLAHLHYARSEAIKRSGRVVMCKSSDGQSCNPAGGWDQG